MDKNKQKKSETILDITWEQLNAQAAAAEDAKKHKGKRKYI